MNVAVLELVLSVQAPVDNKAPPPPPPLLFGCVDDVDSANDSGTVGLRSTGGASVGAILALLPGTARMMSHESLAPPLPESQADFIFAPSSGFADGDDGLAPPPPLKLLPPPPPELEMTFLLLLPSEKL